MIDTDHLETVSLELSKLQELLCALELLTDNLECADHPFQRMVRNGTVGVMGAMQAQAGKTRVALDALFPIARTNEKAA